MRCPKCGAWSEVKETRADDNSFQTRRRRVCANSHLFTTYEVLPPLVRSKAECAKTIRRALAAIQQWVRGREVAKAVRAGVPSKDLAAQYGISPGYVRKVWHRHAASLTPTTPDTAGITDRKDPP